MIKINYAAAMVDIVMIIFAFSVAFWQDNPNYLWLICLIFFTGGYELNDVPGEVTE